MFIYRSIAISIIIVVLFNYVYSYIFFDRKINIRKKKLEYDANLLFEILVLSLKSGKNLEQALKVTIDNTDNYLSKELEEVMKETKYGRSLHEALLDYIKKVPSDSIKSIILVITETYISGKDMVSSIEKELDILEENRIYSIKTYINKLPIRISMISIILLIPLIILLVLSPIILEYLG